jgi:acetylornithine/succinyldiaminopimelate/putrescine aminotransferase
VMIEPIQGEGGIRLVPDQCLKGLRDLCDATGTLLIFDEVQCGMGRTGRLFAHEWAGVTPDIMMVAKGIGGGFPLGAVLATEDAAKGMTTGTHGSTYGGNPLGCAVGAKVVELISDPAFLAEVARKGALFRQGLESLVARHPQVFEAVRGEGLMLGLRSMWSRQAMARASSRLPPPTMSSASFRPSTSPTKTSPRPSPASIRSPRLLNRLPELSLPRISRCVRRCETSCATGSKSKAK